MDNALLFGAKACRIEPARGHGPRRKQSSREADATRGPTSNAKDSVTGALPARFRIPSLSLSLDFCASAGRRDDRPLQREAS
jgi:hypothetical protein